MWILDMVLKVELWRDISTESQITVTSEDIEDWPYSIEKSMKDSICDSIVLTHESEVEFAFSSTQPLAELQVEVLSVF